MKLRISILITFCCMLFTASGFAQKKTGKGFLIPAVQVKNQTTVKFLAGLQVSLFTIDKKGILQPTKGSQIIYFENKKKVYITDLGGSFSPPTTNNDSKDLGGGVTMHCNGCDSCSIKEGTPSGTGKKTYLCRGSCNCLDFIEIDIEEIRYQTPGGSYSNNWNDVER